MKKNIMQILSLFTFFSCIVKVNYLLEKNNFEKNCTTHNII